MTGPYGIPTNDPAGAISRAIVTTNYQQKGVPYGPFLMAAMGPRDGYTMGPIGGYSGSTPHYEDDGSFWTSQRGDFPISFYQNDSGYNSNSGFDALVNGYPLGGVAVPQIPPSPVPAAPYCYYLAPAPGVPAAVAAATDMPWVLDDHGSHNPGDVTYHWATAPDGFHALGTAFWWDNDATMHKGGACVAAAFLEPGVKVPFWSDTGQDWSHDGNLSQVRLAPTTAPTAQLRFSAGTLISEEAVSDGTFDCAPRTLVADAPMLPVPGAGPPSPVPNPGWTVSAVAVLPGLTLNPPGEYGAFCYLGAAICWEIIYPPGVRTPTYPAQLQVGMDPATAARLASDIGAQCGAQHGLVIPPGANGYVSIDLGTLLGVESIPAAKADWDTITVEVDTPLPPDYIPTYQQLVDLFLYDVTGTAIGQSYRFYTAIVSRAQSSQPGAPPNLGVHATEVRPEAGPVIEAGPAPADSPVHKPAPGAEAPAPRLARNPVLAWIAALIKWLFGRLRADK
jgi:hypothetical protein